MGFAFLLLGLLLVGVGTAWTAEPPLNLGIRSARSLFVLGEPRELVVELAGSAVEDVELVFTVWGPGKTTDGPDLWPKAGSWEYIVDQKEAGTVSLTVELPLEIGDEPGAYRVEVETETAEGPVTAGTWLGVVGEDQRQIDLAVVWVLALGPRRDAEGVFTDDAVQASVAPDAAPAGGLYGVLGLANDFPAWRMTVAVEPLYLTQLADIADGYRSVGEAGRIVEIPSTDDTSMSAARSLEALRSVAALEPVQFLPAPYATPHLALLANEGWDDGVDQMRLGKSEFQRLLEAEAPEAAYVPGLDLATNVIRDFSQASMTYVPVLSHVLKDLAEEPESYLSPVRVIDDANNRLTLCPIDSQLRAALAEPWEAARFFAALASKLASGRQGPFVASPVDEYRIPPAQFLKELGNGLSENDFIRTVTLAEVVKDHPAGTRPLFLSRYGGYVEGVTGRALIEELKGARAQVEDYALAVEGAGSTSDALSRARLLLYEAQSMYFFRPGVDPAEVNRAIAFCKSGSALAASELAKVSVEGEAAVERGDGGASIVVQVVNGTSHSLEVAAVTTGDGVILVDEEALRVLLDPGRSSVKVPVLLSGGGGTVRVQILSGGTVLGEAEAHLGGRAWMWTALWVGLGLAILAVALLLVRRVRRLKPRRARPS